MIVTPLSSYASRLDNMCYELHVLRAAADGVQPALLLRAPGKKAEYLFNVPDGFSRLALEQKLTPSARLSCVLLTCLLPAATGGLGGLFLRLKHDGHGQVQMIGPRGLSSIVHSLRHICRWQHPKVFVSECYDSDPIPVFEDEYTVIVPLLARDHSTGCPWCLYASPEPADPPKKDPLATTSDLHNDSSSSDSSDDSSDDTTGAGFALSPSDVDVDSFEKSLSSFNPCSQMGKDLQSEELDTSCKLNLPVSDGALVDGVCHFWGRTQREGCGSKEFLNKLPHERKRKAGNAPLLDLDEGFSGCVKCEHVEWKKIKTTQQSGNGSGGSNADTCRMPIMAEILSESSGGAEPAKSPFVQSTKPFEWIISNLHQDDVPQLEGDSNPVYRVHPATQAKMVSSVGIEKDPKLKNGGGNDLYERDPARVLGYLSYLRKVNAAVLILDCRSLKDLERVRKHPALICIHQTSETHKDDETTIAGKMHTIAAIVHLTPYSLVQSWDYQSWMSSMVSPIHLVMNDRTPEFGFQSSLAMLQKLNKIHQDIFPLPLNMEPNPRITHFTQDLTKSNAKIVDAQLSMCLRFSEEGTSLSDRSVDNYVHPLSNLKKIRTLANTSDHASDLLFAKVEVPRSNASAFPHMSPNFLAATGIKRMLLEQKETMLLSGRVIQNRKIPTNGSIATPLTQIEDAICEDSDRAFDIGKKVATEVAAGVVLSDKQRVAWSQEVVRKCDLATQTRSLTPSQEYMKFYDPASEFQLIFLGTGCAEPSKKRGSSSILLQVRGGQGAMLLDAGEGAAGQLFRRFGEQGATTIITSLQCLWVSHKHGDHALGVLSLLQTRSTQAVPLTIIGPHKVGQWLSEVRDTWSASGYPTPQFAFIHCEELTNSWRYRNNQQHTKQVLQVLGAMQLTSMLTVKVFHCHDAYGIILNGRRGWKVVCSGDTRPCTQLIEAGQGCTLLIHEATFEDTLVEQAKCKRHCTVSEAINVGWQMRARYIILTHFSQRYPEMVTFDGNSNENLSVAFDGMVVPSQLLDLLGNLLPQIRTACQKAVNISSITNTEEQGSELTSKPMLLRHCESAVQQNTLFSSNISLDREPLAAKHKRWSSDSDNEVDRHADGTSLRWPSGSDEEGESDKQGGQTLKSFCQYNSCKELCGTACDSLKGIVGSDAAERLPVKDCQVDRASSHTRETAGPLGGKHVRWIDSDSEDV